MYTDDEVADFVRREGCELLGIDNVRYEKNGRLYKTIRITCTCGHEHQLTFEKFKIGRGRICPKCARPRAERHHAYNPNLTDEDRIANRDVWEVVLWRRNVYARDGYTCRRCGSDKGGNLVAHHLNGWSDYPGQRFDINNGITLCEGCHKSFHSAYGFGHNTVQQYLAWIERDNTEVIAETKKSATP